MPDYRMDIKGKLGLGEYSDIYDYMGIVDKNDNFTITLDASNKQHINIITSMLREGNFVIIDQGIDTLEVIILMLISINNISLEL